VGHLNAGTPTANDFNKKTNKDDSCFIQEAIPHEAPNLFITKTSGHSWLKTLR
jgi:hypothetical protein|tara:strand:- start:1210 stop:1368 length:159 start_codon:yes stop_codon:yes gene_type:complete